jgi:hypothetical protein
MNQLKHAIDNGDIVACSDYLSNVFSASKGSLDSLIKDWQDSYPEIKDAIRTMKYSIKTHKASKFKSKTIDNGREVKFVFLGIRYTSIDELECFELCVKYEFEVYRRQRSSERVGLLERIFLGIATLGKSEKLFLNEDNALSSMEEDNRNLIQRGENGDALAAMMISNRCPELKIKWGKILYKRSLIYLLI